MKTRTLLLVCLLALAACNQGTPTPPPTGTPAPTLPPPPSLTVPSATPEIQTAIATTVVPAATESAASPAPEASSTAAGPLTDRAEFVADVTVPDGTDFAPGATFTKTWRIKNVGTSTWTKDYAIEFVKSANSTNLAGANTSVNLPGDVSPGGIIDISVNLTAPGTVGSYTSLWQFRNASGGKFGVGPNFNEVIYLQIDVVQGGSTGSGPTSTAAPTASGPLNPAKVTKVTLGVNTANVQNDCPHTFVFTAILYIEGGGLVKYQLEANSTTPGFTFSLPAPIESTFTTNGPHTFGVSYTLEMRNAVAGEAWLHVLSPNDLSSDKIPFSLTCPPTATFVPFPTATSVVTVTATP